MLYRHKFTAMHSLLRPAALLLFAVTALAQPKFVGGDLPLTDTRYGTFTGDGVLTTNGRDFFLIWPGAENLRMARLVEGEKRVGKPILDMEGVSDFDVVWTGTHFLVTAEGDVQGEGHLTMGRLLDANGDPAGEPIEYGFGIHRPRLAFNGTWFVMLYAIESGNGRRVVALPLQPDGTPEPSPIGEPLYPVVMSLQGSADFDIASNGSGFGVVGGDATTLVLATLTAEGWPLSSFNTTNIGTAPQQVAIASDGHGYLAVWTDGTGVQARVMTADGSTQPRFALRQAGPTDQYRRPSATWSRSGYHASFLASTSSTYTDVVRIDPVTLTSTSLGTGLHPHSDSSTTIAAVNGRVMAGWRDLDNRPTTRDVSGADGAPAAWGAAEQELGAAASSNSALLAVWSEVVDSARTLRSGVRNHVTGAWSENKIGGDEQVTLAASDGTEFLAITSTDAGWSALQLDANGKLRARSPLVPAKVVHAVIWSGTQYVVAYVDAAQNVKVAAVSRTGTVSQGVIVRPGDATWAVDDMDLASDGTDYFVVWQRSKTEVCFPICDPQVEVLEGIRLDANLQRLGAAQIDIAGDDSHSPAVAWDGSRYVVAWMYEGYRVSTISREGVPSGTSREVASWPLWQHGAPPPHLVRAGQHVLLSFDEGTTPVFVLNGDEVVTTLPAPTTDRTLVALPLGRAAFVGTQLDHSAPHHGARRMHLRIVDTVPTGAVPSAPVASVRHFNGQLRIDWTRPGGAVDGYRVEYRIGDGFWNEIGRWFDAEERTAPWATVKPGQTYAFRVRAMNDNGTSEYSVPAVMYMGKRRAVR
jgi:hypothetical protein